MALTKIQFNTITYITVTKLTKTYVHTGKHTDKTENNIRMVTINKQKGQFFCVWE